MPCPFGYTADDGEEEDLGEGGEVEDSEDGDAAEHTQPIKIYTGEGHTGPFSYEKDPMSWFFQNQIRSEAEFLERKKKLQSEAKGRLEQIMAAKKKLLEFDDDFDDIDGSMHSSELSELDSDVHSLSSLRSCAQSWIEDVEYKAPAEGWVKFATPAAMLVNVVCMYQSYNMMRVCGKVSGVVINTHWPLFCMGLAGIMAIFTGLMWFAASSRSKRMLLASQLGLILTYAVAAGLIAAMYAKPISLDIKLQDVACNKMDNRDIGNRLCNSMPRVGRDISSAFPPLLWSIAAVGASALMLTAFGIWYVFELAYVEKKASKHKRRHRRRKHTIPWHKIKIVGPVLGCGANSLNHGGAKGGAAGSGKCPMGFAAAKDKAV